MEPRWFILADDLTGAADSAIAFARQMPTRVIWGDARPEDHTDPFVLAYDAATRELDGVEAARRHREAMRRFRDSRLRVFKKIDSTLRGHPAEEIAAMLDVMFSHEPATRIVLAPAFPAAGRTVRDGQVCVDGVPLPFTEYWPAGRNPKLGHLVNLMESAGLHAQHVPLSVIRANDHSLRSALGAGPDASVVIAVCD